ncbi:MAG: AraC family transcriptional regulator [bacterium]|nr:AraC family transcriptional regulator [bacterium]MCX7917835.1 AraC family transcriptional regulator [bacterium]MDW8163529.1 AraC family transcriptional regulator [Candidatus Omnitrophota bacterium]
MKKKFYTIKTYEDIKKEVFPLFLGNHLLLVSNVQLNIHEINIPTYSHFHKDYQIIYYLSGSGVERIDNKQIEVLPGMAILIPPFKKHSFIPTFNTEAQIFTLRFIIKKQILKKIKPKERKIFEIMKLLFSNRVHWWSLSEVKKKEIENTIKKISNIIMTKEFGWTIELEGYFYLLFKIFFTSFIEKKYLKEKKSRKEKFFTKIQEYIYSNIESKITSLDIAKKLILSQRYIQKIVKDFTGYSFSNFVNMLRIEKAKELLKNENFQVKYIAHKVGIFNVNYFSRLFKKIEGVSPTKYRDML